MPLEMTSDRQTNRAELKHGLFKVERKVCQVGGKGGSIPQV